jgi:hypothetical protein
VDIVTIVRWTGPRKILRSKRKNGYVVIRVADLLTLARRSGIPLTNMRGLLIIEGKSGRTSQWVHGNRGVRRIAHPTKKDD